MVDVKGANPHVHIDPGGSRDGVIKIVGQTQLPIEFLTIGKNFEEALGRCVMRDDNQRNAVNFYKAQLDLFGMWDEIQDLTNWLNSSAAVGGFNRSLAAMTHTGTIISEGLGVKVSKESRKALEEIARYRSQVQASQNNGNSNNGHQP